MRNADHLGRLGPAGLVAVGTALNFRRDSSLVPVFIFPGLLALVVGRSLLGLAVFTARVLPRRVGALLC